ncbi:Hsp70 family protein [Sphingobacteriales bacterium UPWRP_1]|nr:hypothetical protein BVG80_07385 [Sphingobacteriales bacterium TSM_CSM]PSJ78250.1 Hsp70 family protein [Sphingobacteriales bacterium UPWRP_1]
MRTNIDFGIDLGTTNSSIVKMENGKPKVIKTDEQFETMPSCVHFTQRKSVLVGKKAVNALQIDLKQALKTFSESKTNTFSEFKRTMGTTHLYKSSNMDRSFYSEQLSAEVLKQLKSMVLDEPVNAAVITVPAKFKNQQKEATIRAAKLAGIKQVVLLNEPVAAATAYGLDAKQKDGYWLVYDLGGGTFDVALIKAEDGILKVIDTDGDEWLGGKNLDEAIVDQLLIPYLQKNYLITRLLADEKTREMLRAVLKIYAEEGRIVLSYKDTHTFVSNLGDLPNDEHNKEMELDVDATQADMVRILGPLYQKTIEITLALLLRNNLSGSRIHALILVGGPTHSPILRKMLKEQVTPIVDTSIDPMTAVATGAALFASTIPLENVVVDPTKLQLSLDFEATSVELKETIGIALLPGENSALPAEVWAELARADGGFTSEKIKISEKPALIRVLLLPSQPNMFRIRVIDHEGNAVLSQPEQITIIQGIGIDEMATLHYHIGIGTFDSGENRELFQPVPGLEKNKKLPATGIISGLKTRNALLPGNQENRLVIPTYSGEYNAPGTDPLLNNLIHEVVITGLNIPQELPEGSELEITIKIDRSEHIQFSAYFPLIDHTEDLSIPVKNTDPPTAAYLEERIDEAIQTANHIEAYELAGQFSDIKNRLQLEKGSIHGRFNILNDLRKLLLLLDTEKRKTVWPELEKQLTEEWNQLKKVVDLAKGDERINWGIVDGYMSDYKLHVPIVLKDKDIKRARHYIDDMYFTRYEIVNIALSGELDCDKLKSIDGVFNSFSWSDPQKARQLLNAGLQDCNSGKADKAKDTLKALYKLMPQKDREKVEKK